MSFNARQSIDGPYFQKPVSEKGNLAPTFRVYEFVIYRKNHVVSVSC